MSAILKFDFQKREQLRFSEVNYLNYAKKDTIFHVATTFSLKQGETRTSYGPIPHSLTTKINSYYHRSRVNNALGIISEHSRNIETDLGVFVSIVQSEIYL